MEENLKEKEEIKKKEPDVKTKKKKAKIAVISLSTIVVLFVGLQVYAATNGYGNVFFMIKSLITNEGKVTEQDKIFSDQEITLSYKSIELTPKLKMQANRLEIKDGKTRVYLTIKPSEPEKLPLKYIVSASNKAEKTINGTTPKEVPTAEYQDVLELDYAVGEKDIITLKIKNSDNEELKTIDINLETREITVKGEEKLEKISKIELRKYLDVFAELNNNTSKGDTLIKIAQKMQDNHNDYMDNENYTIALKDHSDRSFKNAIIKEFYGDKADFETQIGRKSKEIEVVKGIRAWSFDKEEDSYKAMTNWEEYRNGHCLKIEEAKYENGVYTIKFIYVLATGLEEDGEQLENLPQYEATIQLKRVNSNLYSKYQVLSITDGKEVKEKVDSKVNEDINTDDFEIIFDANNPSTTSNNDGKIEGKVAQETEMIWYTVKVYEDDTVKIKLTNKDINAGSIKYKYILNNDYTVKGITGKVKKIFNANNGTGVDPMTFFIMEDGTVNYILPFSQLSNNEMLEEFRIDGKIDTAKNVIELKENQHGVIVAVQNDGKEVKIWNQFMEEMNAEEDNNNSKDIKDYTSSENWKEVWPEGIGMKCKLPNDFTHSIIKNYDNVRNQFSAEGKILVENGSYSNGAGEADIRITFIHDQKGNVDEEWCYNWSNPFMEGKKIESKDNKGWSDWKLLSHTDVKDGWYILSYTRTRDGEIEQVIFEKRPSGAVIDEFVKCVLDTVSSTSV